MTTPLPLRQWRKAVREGRLKTNDRSTIQQMGWVEWFCKDQDLTKRTNSIAHLLSYINQPELLDQLTIRLKNGFTMSRNKGLTDTVDFYELKSGQLVYTLKIKCGYETMRFVVYPKRVWDGPLFQTNNEKELASWFNRMPTTVI